MSDDDPTDEYDEPVQIALCPKCNCCELDFDDDRKEDGYLWWCSGCESYVKDADVAKLKLARPRQSRRR